MNDYSKLVSFLQDNDIAFSENEPMSSHTTFKIGGPADLFVSPVNKEALCATVKECTEQDIPFSIIGNGSNLLVSDKGICGVVISTGGLTSISLVGACDIECCAGVRLSQACNFALENSLSGMECLWGIPGTVGGAAYMNAGAYGGEMKDIVSGCEYITPDGEIGYLSGEEMDYSYRHSVFSDNGNIIYSVRLHLQPGSASDIRAKMDDLINRRKEKQPLEYPSAGSVFKRPSGNYAGLLIENAGLKGYRFGGAMVSEKHSGFIINAGGATSFDVQRLISHIKREVFLNSSVELECEIKFIGEE